MSWIVWQLVDSAYPVGAFAHSQGLESAWQAGEVDRGSMRQFLEDTILQTGRASLPFVSDAHRQAHDLSTLDARRDLFLRNVVANRSSRTQGRAWLSTFRGVFPEQAAATDEECAACPGFRAHFAPVFGATLRHAGVSLPETQRLHLYSIARGTLSAAVRLGVVGAVEAQRMLAVSSDLLEEVVNRSADLGIEDAAQVVPLLDIWSALHDRLYSRLFMS